MNWIDSSWNQSNSDWNHVNSSVHRANSNLPVNGDAELVYALEARGSKGEVRTHGGLDQDAVTQAVLDIMEGTEEAFRRRREKYHF